MGRCQTETYYQTEASYLKSVLLWLQEYWAGPVVRAATIAALFRAEDARSNKSADGIIDLPPFLPPRNLPEYRQRKTVNQGRQNHR
jgi:hypothetical protein